MRRFFGATLLLLACAVVTHAHFVLLVPVAGKSQAIAVFSDTLDPDEKVSIDKIAGTKFFAIDSTGKESPLEFKKGTGKLELDVPTPGPTWVVGATKYGVISKKTPNYLLQYFSRCVVATDEEMKKIDPAFLKLTSDNTPFILEPVAKSASEVTVIAKVDGKPVADVEVVLVGKAAKADSSEKAPSAKTDKEGKATVKIPGAGRYALRAKVTKEAKGEHNGAKYDEVHSYATLTFELKGK